MQMTMHFVLYNTLLHCEKPQQVVGIVPKVMPPTMPLAMTKAAQKKYAGHMKYPVTPIRTDILGIHRRRLSLLSDDDDQKVYI